MKTRPHIVTQTRIYPVARLARSADRLSWRMGDVKRLHDLIGYSRVLIRLMKIIMDLTLHNNCFLARRKALATPRSRQSVMEDLGGAPALLKWRRKHIWNKGRLAAIAAGTYRPAPEPAGPPQPPALRNRVNPQRRNRPVARKTSAPAPAPFRLPVLQNLHYAPPSHPRARVKLRRPPQMRLPSIVLWPHELDGQYVPDFQSRARRPQTRCRGAEPWGEPPSGREPPSIFAPP